MRDIITEALVEMHFHRPIVNELLKLFGPGVKFLRLLKPSPQKEAWVGFDQGWIFTKVTTGELFEQLRQAIISQATQSNIFYFGYFLQFKTVKQKNVAKDSILINRGYGRKYFRSDISLSPNKTTKLSQHETLKRLSNINSTTVSYACAMLFDMEDIYREASLDDLRCVDIRTAPTGWLTNERHFIAFRSKADPSPDWCSEPHSGKSLSFQEWTRFSLHEFSGEELRELILSAVYEINPGLRDTNLMKISDDFIEVTQYLPECFTIIEFERTQ